MTALRRAFLSVLVAAPLALPAAAQTTGSLPDAAAASGTWTTTDGRATIRIAPCDGALCARVVTFAEPNDPATGRPKLDKSNPNPALRDRPLRGVQVLTGMRPDGEGRWRGQIYNPDDGRTYAARMSLRGGALSVEGCALSGVLCKAQAWRRS